MGVINLEELRQKADVSKEEIRQWAKKNHPRFVGNERLMTLNYLKEVENIDVYKGQRFDEGGLDENEAIPIRDLEPDEWQVISVLLAEKIRETVYEGCSECFKSEANFGGGACPKHPDASIKELSWVEYIAGDKTGDILVQFGPNLDASELEGEEVLLGGFYNPEDDNFNIRQFEILSIDAEPVSGTSNAGSSKEKQQAESAQAQQSSSQDTEETSQAPPQEAVGSGQSAEQADVPQKEVAALEQVMDMIDEVTMKELRQWYDRSGFDTPLLSLMQAAGLKKDGDTVVKQNE